MKLMNILDYYKGVKHRGQDLPPVDIVSINDVYHLSEGNHRLYVLKWLESLGVIKKPLIKANIEKYDYNHFIQNVSFVQRKFGGEIISYIKFPNDYIEPLDNETYERLLELKKT